MTVKHVFWLALSYLSTTILVAQTYHNEWIDFDQAYYPIPITEEGLYRIDQAALLENGINITDANQIQLYRDGQAVPIYTSTDGTFGANDFIEFYGKRNDGKFDTHLYEQEDGQTHDFRSLFSDQAMYYLAIADNTTPVRIQSVANENTNNLTPEPYCMVTKTKVHAHAYFFGEVNRLSSYNVAFANFEAGEGFVSPLIVAGSNRAIDIATPSVYHESDAPAPTLEIAMVGRNDDFAIFNDHHIQVNINEQVYIDATYGGYETRIFNTTVDLQNINTPTTTINVRALGDATASDQNAVAYTRLTYPHNFNFDGEDLVAFDLDNKATYLEIPSFAQHGQEAVLYDETNQMRIIGIVENGILKFNLPAPTTTATRRHLVLFHAKLVGNSALQAITSLTPYQFIDFNDMNQQGNYLIITHPTLMEGETNQVAAYQNYRNSPEGGSFNAITVDINDLYHQFAYGIDKHPSSIRHFINFALDHFVTKPEYVLLLGKSIRYSTFRTLLSALEDCLLPTYGHQPADHQFGVRQIDELDFVPQISIGRLPAQTPTQVQNYLQKLKTHEAAIHTTACDKESRLWLKNVAQLGQVYSQVEIDDFSAYLAESEAILTQNSSWGANIGYTNIVFDNTTIDEAFATQMNAGIAVLNYIGHYTDFIGTPDDYTNNQRYPLMVSIAPFVNNVHKYISSDGDLSFAEKFVLHPKGAIGSIGASSLFSPPINHELQTRLFQYLFQTNYGSTIGKNMQATFAELAPVDLDFTIDKYMKLAIQTTTLIGDPALSLYAPDKSDFLIETGDLSLRNVDTNEPLNAASFTLPINTNALQIDLPIFNLGKVESGDLLVTMTQQLPDGSNGQTETYILTAPNFQEMLSVNFPIDATITGRHTIQIHVDQINAFEELCENNNAIELEMTVEDTNTPPITIQINAFLEGAYDANTQNMTTILRQQELLPLEQPFSAMPWNYAGTEQIAAINQLPNDIVDWVLIEFYEPTQQTIVTRKAALLRADGSISGIQPNGELGPLSIAATPAISAYHMVLRHRNHVAIYSAFPIAVEQSSLTMDFSQINQVLDGENQMTLLDNGRYALASGDMDGNGIITVEDFNVYATELQTGGNYLLPLGDLNLDGLLNVDDLNFYNKNASRIGVTEIRY